MRIAEATTLHVDSVKQLADAHRHELGFVVRPSLLHACERGGLFVACSARDRYPDPAALAEIVGFVQVHFRRDGQTTLHTIAVARDQQGKGVGRALVEKVIEVSRARNMQCILLRCPLDLPANGFYAALGFRRELVEEGKHRPLAVWVMDLASTS